MDSTRTNGFLFIFWIVSSLFVTISLAPSDTVPTTHQLVDGLILPQESTLHIQNAEWTLLITIDAPAALALDSATQHLRQYIDKLSHQFSNTTVHTWHKQLDWIISSISPIDWIPSSISSTNYHNRPKRGLLDIGGKILHHVFGLATDDELNQYRTLVHRAITSTSKILHASNRMITVIRANLNNTRANRAAIIDIENNLSELWPKFTKQISELQGEVDTIENQLLISETITSLETISARYLRQAEQYLDQRAALERGYLTEAILPRRLLRFVLDSATTTTVRPQRLVWYYQNVHIRSLWTENGTLIYIATLPFVTTEDYIMYRIQSFPVPSVNVTAQIMAAGLIATETQGGGIFRPHHCTGSAPTVCRAGAVYHDNAMTCERGIINGDTEHRRTCLLDVKPLSPDTVITEIQLAQYVIQTTGESFTQNCPSAPSQRHHLREGTHLLIVPDLCNFHGNTWTIHGLIHGLQHFTLPVQRIDHVPFKLLVLHDHLRMLHALRDPAFKSIAALEQIPLETLHPDPDEHLSWSQVYSQGPAVSWITAVVVLILVIGVVVAFRFRHRLAARIIASSSTARLVENPRQSNDQIHDVLPSPGVWKSLKNALQSTTTSADPPNPPDVSLELQSSSLK